MKFTRKIFISIIVILTRFSLENAQPDTAYCEDVSSCNMFDIYGHVACVDRYCKCKPGSFYLGKYCSYNSTVLDSECIYEEDCIVDQAECYRDTSKPNCDKDDPYVIDRCKRGIENCICPGKCACKSTFVTVDNRKCMPKANLNEPCSHSAQCPQDGPKLAICLEEVCRCPSGTIEHGNKCYQQTGGSCKDNFDCLHHALCQDNICICRNSSYYEKNGDCLRLKQYLEACDTDIECGNLRRCSKMQCVCINGYHFNEKRKKCIKNKALEDICEENDECEWDGEEDNMICINNRCNCKQNYIAGKNLHHCVENVVVESNNKTNNSISNENINRNGNLRLKPNIFNIGLFLGIFSILR